MNKFFDFEFTARLVVDKKTADMCLKLLELHCQQSDRHIEQWIGNDEYRLTLMEGKFVEEKPRWECE